MKYSSEDAASMVVVMLIALVAIVGIVCMSVESVTKTREAIKAGLVQDANGKWVKP